MKKTRSVSLISRMEFEMESYESQKTDSNDIATFCTNFKYLRFIMSILFSGDGIVWLQAVLSMIRRSLQIPSSRRNDYPMAPDDTYSTGLQVGEKLHFNSYYI
jgi:hypothetical protein